jgi:hypothetical protein
VVFDYRAGIRGVCGDDLDVLTAALLFFARHSSESWNPAFRSITKIDTHRAIAD